MTPTTVITGATGAVSSALLAALAGSEHQIRALVRDDTQAARPQARGVEVVVGDLDDPDSLPPAFAGVSDLWLLVPNGPRATENSMNAGWAARNAGVERVLRLSAAGAALDAHTRGGRLHALADHDLPRSISFAPVATAFTQVLGTPVGYLPVSDDTQRATSLHHGIPAWIAGMLIEYSQAYAAGWGDYTTSDVVDVLGHPPRPVEDFIRDHAATFA